MKPTPRRVEFLRCPRSRQFVLCHATPSVRTRSRMAAVPRPAHTVLFWRNGFDALLKVSGYPPIPNGLTRSRLRTVEFVP